MFQCFKMLQATTAPQRDPDQPCPRLCSRTGKARWWCGMVRAIVAAPVVVEVAVCWQAQ